MKCMEVPTSKPSRRQSRLCSTCPPQTSMAETPMPLRSYPTFVSANFVSIARLIQNLDPQRCRRRSACFLTVCIPHTHHRPSPEVSGTDHAPGHQAPVFKDLYPCYHLRHSVQEVQQHRSDLHRLCAPRGHPCGWCDPNTCAAAAFWHR